MFFVGFHKMTRFFVELGSKILRKMRLFKDI